MTSIIIDYRRYPFLLKPREALEIKYPGLRLEDVLMNRESYPFTRSLRVLKTIITRGYVLEGSGTSEDEVLVFYALLIGARAFNDHRLIHRIAVAYSKYASDTLAREPPPVLVAIGRKMGLDVELSTNPPKIPLSMPLKRKARYLSKPISINLVDYLRITSKRLARDPKYMLVNQIVDHGRVYVERELFTRILEEAIYNRIVEIADEVEASIDEINDYLEEYKHVLEECEWYTRRQVEEYDKEIGYEPTALPPCMKTLIDRLLAGENIGHHERFTIAAFLIHIGLEPDEVLEYFKKAPDFNEKIARYQVEHIAGLRGSRKKYLPYNCDTMKSLGLCPINGYCGKGKNPLTIYRINLFKLKKKEKVIGEASST